MTIFLYKPNKRIFTALMPIALLATACQEHAHVRVQNKVHNVTLQKVSWDNYAITEYLRPGETSDKVKIVDKKESWPKTSQVELYMVGNGNTVYLKTKAKFELDVDDNLLVVISDTTSVYNPLLE